MEKEKAKNQSFKNWEGYWTSVGIMLGCIEFLIRNTREKKISWTTDGFVGDLNGAITFRGTLPGGGHAVIEQTIVCTHFWNSINIYDSSGEIESMCMPDWEHGKDFWLLISMARQQVLDQQLREACKKQLAKMS